jgi:hypothetical protein
VVYKVRTSVVACPTWQFVTVGLHDVMVYVRVLRIVEVSVRGVPVLLGHAAADELSVAEDWVGEDSMGQVSVDEDLTDQGSVDEDGVDDGPVRTTKRSSAEKMSPLAHPNTRIPSQKALSKRGPRRKT